jgi:ArsR family transcriptional regulator, arsenate/arsenite/antimonite-responsive transcriptional repressor
MNNQNSIFQALADPTRREILRLLRQGDLTPGELAASFNITKPSLSHHLDALKKADLVVAERRGQNIIYSLNLSVFEETVGLLLDLFGKKQKKKKGVE